MKLDWVVNEDTYGRNAAIVVNGGNAAAAPLTYPRFVNQVNINLGGVLRLGGAFPDGEKQFVKAVVGTIHWQPSVWAAGTILDFTLRITKKPFDAITGGAIVDAAYDLQDEAFANERFAWQFRERDNFIAGTETSKGCRVRATVNQWLEPDEALYLFYQNDITSNITFFPMLRTLMKAEA